MILGVHTLGSDSINSGVRLSGKKFTDLLLKSISNNYILNKASFPTEPLSKSIIQPFGSMFISGGNEPAYGYYSGSIMGQDADRLTSIMSKVTESLNLLDGIESEVENLSLQFLNTPTTIKKQKERSIIKKAIIENKEKRTATVNSIKEEMFNYQAIAKTPHPKLAFFNTSLEITEHIALITNLKTSIGQLKNNISGCRQQGPRASKALGSNQRQLTDKTMKLQNSVQSIKELMAEYQKLGGTQHPRWDGAE